MREITKKILALGLFKVESTEAADTKHWEIGINWIVCSYILFQLYFDTNKNIFLEKNRLYGISMNC